MIDYLDIVSVSRLMIPNEEAADHPEKFVRTNYKFNYLIQIEVSAINGLSVIEKRLNAGEYESNSKLKKLDSKESQETEAGAVVGDGNGIVERSQMSLANIFFKVRLRLMVISALVVTRGYISDAPLTH